MTPLAEGEMIVGDGTTDPVAQSGATLRSSIGVGTGNSPQFTAIELGHKSDTTIARVSAGVASIEGAEIRTGTVAVANGGTGATSLTDGGILLGSGTGAVTAMNALGAGEMIVGDGTTDPIAQSGATLRTSIGVGTGDSPQFTAIELGHADDTTIARVGKGVISVQGNTVLTERATVTIEQGGTGATSLTDHGILLGSGTDAVTATSVLTDGQLLIGDTSNDPAPQTVGGDITITKTGVVTIANDAVTGAKIENNPTIAGNLTVSGQIELGHADDTTIARVDKGVISVQGNTVLTERATVTIEQGGTGATSLTDHGILLGSGTAAITATSVLTDGQLLIGDSSNDPAPQTVGGDITITKTGVVTIANDVVTGAKIENDPTIGGNLTVSGQIELGHASDTTLARSGSGVVTIEGAEIRTGTVAVANGGTGATSLTDGGILLGSGTGAITAMTALADGEMIVGDGSGDPVAESGATLRTSIGVGTTDSPQFAGLTVTGSITQGGWELGSMPPVKLIHSDLG